MGLVQQVRVAAGLVDITLFEREPGTPRPG